MLEKWRMRTTRLCCDLNRYKVIGVSNLQQIIIIMYVEMKQLVADKWWNSCTFFFIHEILVHSFRSYHWVRIYIHKTNPDSLSKRINGPIRYSKVQFATLKYNMLLFSHDWKHYLLPPLILLHCSLSATASSSACQMERPSLDEPETPSDPWYMLPPTCTEDTCTCMEVQGQYTSSRQDYQALHCETIHSRTSASCFAVSSSTTDWWRVCKMKVS